MSEQKFTVTSLEKEYQKDLQSAVIKALRNDSSLYIQKEKDSDMFYSEIYTDYRDELTEENAKEILESNCPWETFDEKIMEWYEEHEWDLFSGVRKMVCEDSKVQEIFDKLYKVSKTVRNYDLEEYVRDYIYESWYIKYPEDHFLRQDVRMNIMVDTGEMNYDFTKNNVLNWDGQYSEGEFEETSSILWLAKQQGKEEETKRIVKEYFDTPAWVEKEDGTSERNTFECEDKFISSIIQELENLSCHMGTLTFLVTMTLEEAIKLKETIKAEPKTDEYYPWNNKGNGEITISKDTTCGLFSPWQGGGSCFEIELDKDVILPIKYIFKAIPEGRNVWNYGIDEVYGMCGDAWKGTVKEVKENTIESEVI